MVDKQKQMHKEGIGSLLAGAGLFGLGLLIGASLSKSDTAPRYYNRSNPDYNSSDYKVY